MKRTFYSLLLIVFFLLNSLNSDAQITLEHTFEGMTTFSTIDLINYNGNSNHYICIDEVNNQVKLYNTDYSLYKTINSSVPAGYVISTASHFSASLFGNNKIAFLVIFISNLAENEKRQLLQLYDEDGLILKDFGYGGAFSNSIHKIPGGNYRLSVLRYNYSQSRYNTEIYSLPGKITSNNTPTQPDAIQPPYPNPAHSLITLPYQLAEGESATMRVFNIQGGLVEQKQIDFVFDRVLLDVSHYMPGAYLYEVNGKSLSFIVQ